MEKYFGSSYRGDPGVPHAKPARFWNIWFGSIAYTAILHIDPHIRRKLYPLHNFHDKAMVFEQYQWKKAMAKKQPYKFKWNELDKEIRDSYYVNWPLYFP